MSALGSYLRKRRSELCKKHDGYSIRAVARRIGIHHSYLSKLERGEHAPLSDKRIIALARDLGEDEEFLLALGGKIPESLAQKIKDHPLIFRDFLYNLEQEDAKGRKVDSYTLKLEQRKSEFEILARSLRDDLKKTKRIHYEMILAGAEKDTILSNLKDIVIVHIDSNYNLLWASQAIQEHLSCPLNQALGKKCYSVINAKERPCSHCTVKLALKTGQIQKGMYTTRTGQHWIVKSVPIKNAFGRIEKVVHFGFNGTELKDVRVAVDDTEHQWRFTLDGAKDRVLDWSIDTKKQASLVP